MTKPLETTASTTTELEQLQEQLVELQQAMEQSVGGQANHRSDRALSAAQVGDMARTVKEGTVCTATEMEANQLRTTLQEQLQDHIAKLKRTIEDLKREIERRESVELALRENEQFSRSLYDNNPSMYFTLSPEGTVLSVNKYGAEQLGYKPDDLVGRSVLAVFKPEDHETVLGQLTICTGSPGKLFEWEIQKIRGDDTVLWVKERAQAILDRTGRVLVLVVCEDVTVRRLTEEIVRESEERWRALFEHAGVGIAQLSLSGQFLRVNPRLCETLGYSSKTMLQLTFRELTHPEDLQAYLLCLKELLAGTRPSFSMEKRYRRSDDTWIWVNLTVSLVRTASSAPAYFIGVVEDISERRRSEEALRESEQAIRSLHEAASTPGLTFDQRMQTVLELGRRRFKLPIGVLTKVLGDQLELTHICADDETLKTCMPLPLCQTYCSAALTATGVLCFEETGASEWCYIGTRLTSPQRIQGTMCFMGAEPYAGRFSQADKDFLLLMARWVSGEIERRESERALKEQEALLRSVIDTATDAIFMKDRDGRYRFINQAGALILGKPPEQIIGKNDAELLSAPTASRLMADDREVFSSRTQRRYEAVIPLDGQPRTFAAIKTPHKDQDGQVIGLVGVSRDITDAKRAEEALRLTQIAVDRAADLAFWITPDARFLYVNDAACERLGYSRAELLSMTVADIDPDYQLHNWPAHWDDLRRNGQLRFESRHRTKSGEIYPVEVVANYVAVERHEYDFAFSREITERKHVEEALRESEERFAKAFRSSPHPVIVTELETGRCLEVNDAGLRLFGYLRHEAIGQTLVGLGLWPTPEHRTRFFDRLAAEGSVRNLEATFWAKDRTPRQCLISSEVIELKGTRCLVTVGTDVTEQARAEKALWASELRFQQFVAEAPVGLVILDERRRLLTANKAFCKLTGYEEQELIGRTYDMYTHPDDLSRNLVLTEEFYRGVRREYTIDKRYVRKTGDTIWVSVKATSIDLPNHPDPLLLAAVQDITDQKRATEERERLSQDLHDNILQSLYAVGMQLEASKLAVGKSPRKSKVHASQAIDQLNHLVGDVRHFIALLKQGTSPQMDFGGALHQLVSAFSTAGHRPPELDIKDGILKLIAPNQAEQLLNIAREALSNSVRHAQATHRSIRLSLFGQMVRMQVCDDGIGFIPKLKRKQGHGLVNMAARAKKIGARLRLTSQPNEGTCVTVDLSTEESG